MHPFINGPGPLCSSKMWGVVLYTENDLYVSSYCATIYSAKSEMIEMYSRSNAVFQTLEDPFNLEGYIDCCSVSSIKSIQWNQPAKSWDFCCEDRQGKNTNWWKPETEENCCACAQDWMETSCAAIWRDWPNLWWSDPSTLAHQCKHVGNTLGKGTNFIQIYAGRLSKYIYTNL